MLKATTIGLHSLPLSPEEGTGDAAVGATDSGTQAANTAATNESTPPVGGDGDGAPTGDLVPRSELEALQAQMAKQQEFIDRIKDAEKTERSKRQEAQEQQGEYKALAESLKQEREELERQLQETRRLYEEAQPVIERTKAREQELQGQVEQRMANGLPEYLKTAIRGMTDVQAQWDAISQYDRDRGLAPDTKPSTPSGGPPAPGTQSMTLEQIGEAVAKGADLAELLAQNQDAVAAESGRLSGTKPTMSAYLRGLLPGR
jgi:DNA repair exonuclease SbcCD ATPase subunit